MDEIGSFANRLYRIVATGFCFSCFGLGGLMLSLLVFPMQRLFVRDTVRRRQLARASVHKGFAFFIWLMQRVGVINYDFSVQALLSDVRGKIIIANHPSLIDVVALIAMTPNADCVVKEQLFRNPFVRGVIASTGYISNSDPDGLIADCAASLAAGNNLIIFPEGTRTTPGSELSFQRGAANIALRSRSDFLALLIRCEPSTLTKQESWYQVPERKPTLAIHYLKEIPLTAYLGEVSISLAARHLTKDLQQYYQQVVNENGCTEA
ncbi:lysophospholipid acyltransferase family protein [Nitrincola sp. MINF-07-Sa-05]|uniref:lysophospholipid acyltransferase family protein n=1 Tax=Nitrincola salilacus TaxID=3400273 RepID=UPI0039183B8B